MDLQPWQRSDEGTVGKSKGKIEVSMLNRERKEGRKKLDAATKGYVQPNRGHWPLMFHQGVLQR